MKAGFGIANDKILPSEQNSAFLGFWCWL